MRLIKNAPAPVAPEQISPAAVSRIGEIQQEMRAMCEPRYDEFHKTRVEHGFVTITIPKTRRR